MCRVRRTSRCPQDFALPRGVTYSTQRDQSAECMGVTIQWMRTHVPVPDPVPSTAPALVPYVLPSVPGLRVTEGTHKLYLLRFVLASAVLTAVLPFSGLLFVGGLRLFRPGKLQCVASFPSPYHLRSTTLACVLAHPTPHCGVVLRIFVGVACLAVQKGP